MATIKLQVVPIYAGFLAIYYVGLTLHVVLTRSDKKIAFGTKGNAVLETRIRRHGNFSEYVPISLILFSFLEINQSSSTFLHSLCISLSVGRFLHTFGLDGTVPKPSPIKMSARVIGMVLTVTSINVAAVTLILSCLELWP